MVEPNCAVLYPCCRVLDKLLASVFVVARRAPHPQTHPWSSCLSLYSSGVSNFQSRGRETDSRCHAVTVQAESKVYHGQFTAQQPPSYSPYHGCSLLVLTLSELEKNLIGQILARHTSSLEMQRLAPMPQTAHVITNSCPCMTQGKIV